MNDEHVERLTKVEAYFAVIAEQFEEIKTGVHDINVTLTGNSKGYKHGLVYKTDETREMLLQHLDDCKEAKVIEDKRKKSRQAKVWEIVKPVLQKCGQIAIAAIVLIVLEKLGLSSLIDSLL
jgi:lysyl-tRNA synthetase class I